MSLAVLRTFISKREQEHEARLLSRKTKIGAKEVSEPVVVEPIDVEQEEKSNEQCDVSEEVSLDEPCSISENPATNHGGKGMGELKPARVLEVVIEFMLLMLFPLRNN